MAITVLADPVDPPKPLFEARGVPRQVVVDHEPAELEVDALARGLCRNANLAAGAELLLGALALARVHTPVDLAGRVTPSIQMLAEVGEGVAVFREDKELATAVGQLVELGLGETLAESGELRVRC